MSNKRTTQTTHRDNAHLINECEELQQQIDDLAAELRKWKRFGRALSAELPIADIFLIADRTGVKLNGN